MVRGIREARKKKNEKRIRTGESEKDRSRKKD